MNQSHQREADVFDAALELPTEQRSGFLDQACAGDAALRGRIEALLKASENTAQILDSPVAPDIAGSTPILPLSEKPGDHIGRYKLLQQIGEGGCGVVYMAEQLEPVRRRVALKIIKLGMDTKSVIARFEAERQALALMDHPNIAKVLDAGATDTGRPYFVMELVRGMKITDYCDEAKLSTRARLDLFTQVCQAIQHAHQKGIIHRDIKPSNILVTVNDGVPVPKVIDFGIAKATSGQLLTDKTLFTAFEQFIGTPAYMSPEQALLTSVDIDTQSDIYALGVLLYELLTSKTPFDSKELLAIGLDEMRRTIREKEPPRPSTCVSTLPGQELSTTAQRRGLEAPKLISELRGDLDWIVMKALEKDRSRRYETANALVMDIQRHLNNEPVVACPPSASYRFRKMVRRNKLAFSAATAVVLALILGLGLSTWMFLRERDARKRAIAAEQAERKLRQVADLRRANVEAFFAEVPSRVEARKKVLEEQRRLYGNEHSEVADSLFSLAGLYVGIERDFSEAEKCLEESISIRRKLSPQGDGKLADILERYAFLLADQKKQAEGVEVFRELVKLNEKLHGHESMETASAINNLAKMLAREESEEVPALYREAFQIARKLLPAGDHQLGVTVANVLGTAINAGELAEAAQIARDFIPAQEKPENSLSAFLDKLVFGLSAREKLRDAEDLLKDIVSKAPNNPRLLHVRADFFADRARSKEAITDFRRIIELEPEEHSHLYELAALLAVEHEKAELEDLCRRFFEKFGRDKDWHPVERAAKSALLVPLAAEINETAIRLARNLDENLTQHWDGYWAALIKGLADYRDGEFQRAIIQLAGACKEQRSLSCRAQACAVTAMAHFRLKEFRQAQEALARAKELVALKPGDFWHDWSRAAVLTDEATSLIDAKGSQGHSVQ